jgi:hypothetical protein
MYPNTITVLQWYFNDTLVPGANSSVYTISDITTIANVKMQVFTPSKCANPDNVFSNSIGLHINTGVVNISPSFRDIELFPNPNNGSFMISGALSNYYSSTVSYDITDILGQVIISDKAEVTNNEISKKIDLKKLQDGIYVLHLNGEGQNKILRFTVQH